MAPEGVRTPFLKPLPRSRLGNLGGVCLYLDAVFYCSQAGHGDQLFWSEISLLPN